MTEEEADKARLDYKLADLQEYLETGEIRKFLSMDATLAMCNAGYGWNRIRPDVAEFQQRWIGAYALVYADITQIMFAAKEFELRHWMGFCDEDVAELTKSYRHWTYFDWHNATEEEGNAIRDLWNPQPWGDDDEASWRKSWQKYIDRRARKPLQEIYNESPTFLSNKGNILDRLAVAVGFKAAAAFVDKHLKVSMGSSAGRVLLTMEDRVDRKSPDNVFNGAHLTLIFDETAGWPRGGVQSQAATRDEALGMLKALSDFMPALTSDTGLRIG
jgi:hypothetical protein